MMKLPKALISVTAMLAADSLVAQPTTPQPQASPYLYADLADLALSGPVVAELRIRKAQKLPMAPATGVSVKQRYLITADTVSVIRAPAGIAQRVEFLYDAPRDSLGRLPKLNKANVTIAAFPVTGKSMALQLASPDALIMTTPATAPLVRSIIKAAIDPSAPPEVSGVGSAFYVPGSLEGEGDTQIFLTTRDGRPISFNVVRTPAAAPRWSVSIDELVDASGAQPRRDSFLWYRLACFLPPTLPAESSAGSPEYATILAEDYATIIRGLGPCRRLRR